jgi:hypothetical protein
MSAVAESAWELEVEGGEGALPSCRLETSAVEECVGEAHLRHDVLTVTVAIPQSLSLVLDPVQDIPNAVDDFAIDAPHSNRLTAKVVTQMEWTQWTQTGHGCRFPPIKQLQFTTNMKLY